VPQLFLDSRYDTTAKPGITSGSGMSEADAHGRAIRRPAMWNRRSVVMDCTAMPAALGDDRAMVLGALSRSSPVRCGQTGSGSWRCRPLQMRPNSGMTMHIALQS